ncbi:MAG TPA: twin-arginine translocase subunit TatC [Candidatus Saccharimonadales bacterium]|nr:twin-arginine translocase subunit TatC [Candidatus Saccharimonadales bacterium]
MSSQKPLAPASKTAKSPEQPLPTFLDHVHELRKRLFWVVGSVLVVSSAAYSFLGVIINLLTRPLGDQQLFYLTPAGGLSFSIKLCAYVGMIVAVPLIMFHIYRFLEPLMGKWRKSAVFYLGFSSLLATSGVLFAYFISLPAALHFLTGFSNVASIQAMLTADSYLTFVTTYLLGAALLFQIPLLLLIINTMTPLKPSKLMKLQRYVIVGAFILGAIISPTPDIMNQTFLALPIIGMYQLGVVLVWIQNKALRGRRLEQLAEVAIPDDVLLDLSNPLPEPRKTPRPAMPLTVSAQPVAAKQVQQIAPRQAVRKVVPVMSDIAPRQVRPMPAVPQLTRQVRPAPKISVPARTVDGFTAYRAPISAQMS